MKKAILLVFLLIVPLLTLNFSPVKAEEPIWILENRGENYDIFYDSLDSGHKQWVSAPQRVQDSSGDWVDYVYSWDESKQCHVVQTGLISAKIFLSGYASFWTPDLLDERVKSETWEVWSWEGKEPWKPVELEMPLFDKPIQNSTGVYITMTQQSKSIKLTETIGVLTVLYHFRIGSPLKHYVYWKSNSASNVTIEIKQRWDLKTSTDKVVLDGGNLVTASTTTNSMTYLFGDRVNSFLVLEDQRSAMYYPNGTLRENGRFEMANIDVAGKKVIYTFANCTLSKNEMLEIDPTTTTYFATDALSGYDQYGQDDFYPPTTHEQFLNTGYIVGQQKDPAYPLFTIWEGIVTIDTSSIPDDATISSATFKVSMSTDYSDTDFNVEVSPGGSISTSGWTGQRSVSVSPGSVSKTSTTDFSLVSSREGTEPTGYEYVVLGGGQIEVTYTVPPTQYYLTVTTSRSTQTGQGWYDSGTTAYAGVATGTVSGGTGIRYVFTHWSGDASGTNYAQSNGISMTSHKTAIANWKTQYYFSVSSVRGSPTGEAWYDSGTTTVKSTVTTPSGGYETAGWTGTGSLSSGGTTGSDDTGTFTITQYSTCTWNWEDTAPTYSSLSASTTIAGVFCDFNATFNDNLALESNGQYQFGTNNTDSWTWEDAVNFTSTPQTVSVEKTLNSTVGQVVGYCWNFTDNVGASSTTGIQTFTLTSGFSAITANTTIADKPVTLSVTIDDDVEVSHYIWSWNNTGTMVNGTTTAWTSNPVTFDGTWNDTAGNTVSVLVYANDTSNNWIETAIYNFTLVNYHAYFTYFPVSPIQGDSVDITLHVQKAGEVFNNYIANVTRNGSLWKINVTLASNPLSDLSLEATTRTYTVTALYDTDLSDYVDYSVTPESITWTGTGPPSSPGSPPPPAATYAVSIRVVRGTAPVPAVTVTLAEQSRTTDDQGYVTFSASSGTHNLRVVQEGTVVYSSQLQVTKDGTWQIDLNQPNQPPLNITPEQQQILPEIPSEIAQLGIVIIVAVILVAFVSTQTGKGKTERDWRNQNRNLKKGKEWRK